MRDAPLTERGERVAAQPRRIGAQHLDEMGAPRLGAPKYVPGLSGVIRICRVHPAERSEAMIAALEMTAAIVPRVAIAVMK